MYQQPEPPREHFCSFIGRPTALDFGLGMLYFFTSHMVIRTTYHVGVGRSVEQIALFFLVVLASIAATHLLSSAFIKLRQTAETSLGIPIVSVIAVLGTALALISMLPDTPLTLFYASGGLLGISCAWIVVIWTSTVHASSPSSSSFFMHPSLLVAVATYFAFRLIGTFSVLAADGFLLALPLIALILILKGYEASSTAAHTAENRQALQTLVIVAAAFAIGGSVVVEIAGDQTRLSSAVNAMVLFEVVAVCLILFCCGTLSRYCQRRTPRESKRTTVLVFAACCLPTFLLGLVMGSSGIPGNSPDSMWESNMWVLLVAIFAYDARESLYAVKGLALGLVFEAMCMGQLIARAASFNLPAELLPLPAIIAVAYFAGVWMQLAKGMKLATSAKQAAKQAKMIEAQISAPSIKTLIDANAQQPATLCSAMENLTEDQSNQADLPTQATDAEASTSAPSEALGAASVSETPAEIAAYCKKLAVEYGLTPREAEVLGFLVMGRSAKYMAEELTLSFNTVRTHVKHVYEKLNVHSKQELIDMALFGSGLM